MRHVQHFAIAHVGIEMPLRRIVWGCYEFEHLSAKWRRLNSARRYPNPRWRAAAAPSCSLHPLICNVSQSCPSLSQPLLAVFGI